MGASSGPGVEEVPTTNPIGFMCLKYIKSNFNLLKHNVCELVSK